MTELSARDMLLALSFKQRVSENIETLLSKCKDDRDIALLGAACVEITEAVLTRAGGLGFAVGEF